MTRKLPAQAFSGMEYIRRYYDVPAKQGGLVLYTDWEGGHHYGTITSAKTPYLNVRFEGDRVPLLCHPNDLDYIQEDPR